MFRKIMYFHYQRSLRDGSHVHTQEFERAFLHLCEAKGIAFSTVAPPQVSGVSERTSAFSRIRRLLAKYYLRDFRILISQWRRAAREQDILRNERPDIVLTRFDDNTLSILWACRREKIPVVVEINGPVDEFNHGDRRFSCFKRLFSNMHAVHLANGGFAVSEEIGAPIRALTRQPKPFITIPNGVDTDRFQSNISGKPIRDLLGISKDRIVVGYVGSFAPWHGLDLLVDAIEQLAAENLPIHLMLVGQANPKWQATLDRVRKPELRDFVTLAGFVAPQSIPEYVAAMDITVLPNAADYCSPLKLFEYMSMAKPTVAVGIPPVVAMLTDGVEGFIFPKGDVEKLTKRLKELVQNSEQRQLLGSAARKRMESEFTWKHNAERVYALLESAQTSFDLGLEPKRSR
jgi:glycosyltransferase involved in cell wall biosynthesis